MATILYGNDVVGTKIRAFEHGEYKGSVGKIRLGYKLRHIHAPITSFESLGSYIHMLHDQPHMYLVRGEVIPNAPEFILRRYRREPAYLLEVPQQWVLVDIDGRTIPIDAFADPQGAVAYVKRGLPEGLRNAKCHYAITGSCQRYSVHVHMWFWLDRPYSGVECKRHLAGLCDTSLFIPTQPHFTCDPIVENDPLAGRRRGVFDGSEAWLGESAMLADPEQALRELEAAQSKIIATTKGNRHRKLNQAAYHLARHIVTNAIDRGQLINALVAAAQQSGLPSDRAVDEVRRGVADGVRDAPMREGWEDKLARTESGTVRTTYYNVATALSESPDWSGTIGWNERFHRVEWLRSPGLGGFETADSDSPFLDEHALVAAEWLNARGMSPSRGGILDAVTDVAHRNTFDPVRNVLGELSWDGVERIQHMFPAYFGASASKGELLAELARRWMIAAVARVYEPGCKADNILVLEGPQGTYKSTALEVLGLGYTREVRVRLDDKDASDALHAGCWIAVLTELDAFKRTRGVEAPKAFLSALEDHYRRAYARMTQTHKRSVVFAATTNEEIYLNDPTGNRRFWPVACGDIQIDALRRDVEQLWAEARQYYLDGEQWHLDKAWLPMTQDEQAQRVLNDSWEEIIDTHCRGRDFVTLRGVLDNALQLEPVNHSLHNQNRVQAHLRRLGYHACIRMIDGNRVKGWERR